MITPPSRPDSRTAREHAEAVREALHRVLCVDDHGFVYEGSDPAAIAALDAMETLLKQYRAVLKSDGHGSPSFHMSTCPGCAALRDEAGHS